MKNNVRIIRTVFLATLIIISSLFLFSCTKDDECKHDFEETVDIEPLCNQKGTKLIYCKLCGYEYEEEIPADGTSHSFIESDTLKEKNASEKNNASCGENYNVYGLCEYCGEEGVIATLKKESHVYSMKQSWYEEYKDNQGVIDNTKHVFCQANSCEVCGEKDESSITRTIENHNSNLKHSKNVNKAIEENCCQYYENKCTCGYEYSLKVSHQWNSGDVLVKPTCTEGGEIKYTCTNPDCVNSTRKENLTPLGHQYKSGDEKKDCCDRLCLRCSETILKTADHEYPLDFDCCDRVCSKCGHEIVHTLEHNFKDEFTCHDRTCTICNSFTIDATTTHDLTVTEHKRQNCTLLEYYEETCKICGDTVKFRFEGINDKHELGDPFEIIEPTCISAGSIKRKCLHCEYIDNEEIKPNSHEYRLTHETDPTCTSDGEKVYECSFCKAIDHVLIQATGHRYEDEATCHDRVCLNCGETLRHTTNHILKDGTTICETCGMDMRLSTPVLLFDSEKKKVYVENETMNIHYYIYSSSGEKEEFSGNMYGKADDKYKVVAINRDMDGILLDSEESNPIYIYSFTADNALTLENVTITGNNMIRAKANLAVEIGYKFDCTFYKNDEEIYHHSYSSSSGTKSFGYDVTTKTGTVIADKVVVRIIPDVSGEEAYFLNDICEEIGINE